MRWGAGRALFGETEEKKKELTIWSGEGGKYKGEEYKTFGR